MRPDPLSATFSALADPTRRAILARLADGEATIGELAEPFDLSLPTVSRHIKVLQSANLITRRTDAQWRRCTLQPQALRAAAEWIERYRAYWDERLDALVRYVAETRADAAGRRTHPPRKTRARRATRRRRR